jgi:glycosyltransferase involved in cell wall biosynthesis
MVQNNSVRSKNGSKATNPDLPLISIITIVYNGAATIEQTIKSVISQSYENLEYIIIDGGSTDGTLDIIKKYKDQIDYWISEPDKGIYDAMNKGISYANGELIGIINADDWYEPDIISYIADCFINTDQKTVIHGLLRNIKDEQFYSIKGNSIHVLKYDMIQHPTCFIPKTIYQQYGLYDLKFKYSADYDLVLRYVNSGIQFEFIEQVIANFRIGGISSAFKAQSEAYLILKRHKVISGSEAALRILLLYFSRFVKKIIQ